jgi:hypothetical protein
VPQQRPFDNVLVGVNGTSTGRDAIALADRLCARGGRLTLANIVLMPTPTYRNFHMTPVGRDRFEMLPPASSPLSETSSTCWWWGHAAMGRSGA